MPLSHYLKTFPCPEQPCHKFYYSTKKTSLLLLNDTITRAIDKGTLSPEDTEALTKFGILTPDFNAEQTEVLAMLDDYQKKDLWMNLSVYLNLECNFSCVYCYEGDMKGRIQMSEETASDLVNFIKTNFPEGKKFINLDFYGGEPLLSRGLIKYISSELKPFAESRGAQYLFSLVTNGSLLTRKTAEELLPLGMRGVKITLDGPADVHNRYRPFKSGEGSFDTIIRNIKDTCDIVRIGLGGNFEKSNFTRFVELLDYLEREGITPDKLSSVKFDPVLNRPSDDATPTDYRDGCMSINEPWVWEAHLMLREEILKRDYVTSKLKPLSCQVEIKDYYAVNYDGTLYRCPAFIGRKGFEAGHVKDGVSACEDAYNVGKWKEREECRSCEYLPICFGGCRFTSYIKHGDVTKIDCKKAYLDATLESLIKQDIKYKKSSGQ